MSRDRQPSGEARPGTAPAPEPERWISGTADPGHERAAALFRQVAPPPPLRPNQLERIAARLEAGRARPAGSAWRPVLQPILAAAVVAAIVAGAVSRLAPSAGPRGQEPSGVRLATGGAVAGSPGAATVRIEGDRTLARAGAERERLVSSLAQVELAPGAVVEIDAHERRVACYQGEATVIWTEGEVLSLRAGQAGTRAGITAVDPARRDAALLSLAMATPRAAPPARGAPASEGAASTTSAATASASPSAIAAPSAEIAGGDGRAAGLDRPGAPSGPRAPQHAIARRRAGAAVAPRVPAKEAASAAAPLPHAAGPDGDDVPPARETRPEYRSLAAAQERLYRGHDAAGAIALLDEHAARFPGGELAREAQALRVDALVARGRQAEALALLDGQVLGAAGRDRAQRALRAELRAAAGRCPEALLDAAALREKDDAPAERALYLQAACHARAGERAASLAALQQYLARFPSGRFAERVRRTLASTTTEGPTTSE